MASYADSSPASSLDDDGLFVQSDQAELIQTGLSCLLNDHNRAMITYNVAYLVVLVDAYRRTQIIASKSAAALVRAHSHQQSFEAADQPNLISAPDPRDNDNPLPKLFY